MARSRTRKRGAVRPTPVWQRSSTLIGGAVAIVIIAVVAFLLVSKGHNGGVPTGPASASVVKAVTQPSASVLSSVGTASYENPLTPLTSAPALTGSGGKPEVLYVGAEYCPYCAAERWSLIMALGRFGTFSNLHYSASSSSDVYPNTPTFTFHGSSYSSRYVDFVPVETTTRDPNQALETPTAQQQQLLQQYDTQPYTSGGIPFIDIANRYVTAGAGYDPQMLSGLTHEQIARKLRNPNDPLTRGIVANANYLTAAICETTHDRPASVCQSPPVSRIQPKLGGR